MERIIIREVDNTSNVEQLSSYDVVYVPGFARSPSSEYFRTPTLFTSKYQFLNALAPTRDNMRDAMPTFAYDQEYPVASASKRGFPTYAIPYYKNSEVDTTGINLVSFDSYDTFDNYYTAVEIVAPPDEPDGDWSPSPGVNYFLMSPGAGESCTVEYTTLPLQEGATYIDTYGDSNVFVSAIDPKALGWFEAVDEDFVRTSDTQIGVGLSGDIKTYYNTIDESPAMFYSGEPDPGFRYALYLLSLGIPVYYEVMNMGEGEAIDLISDFNTALIKYGTTENDETYISPFNNGWYYRDGVNYVKCTDDSIKIRTVNDDAINTTWYKYADISVESMYKGLEKRFLSDPSAPDYSFDSMGDYSVKYITSGGYPTFEYGFTGNGSELAYAMMDLASKREDAVALIDHTNNPERTIYAADELSVSFKVREEFANADPVVSSYGAMFTPWYSCTHTAITGETGDFASSEEELRNSNIIWMPASLAFLSALAIQLRNYNPWLAVSGVTRGKVPYFGSLHTNQLLTNNVADSYQSVPIGTVSDDALISINPITYIRQYGYCIWGNRTLRNNKSGTKATSFLNIRNLVSDIKKRLYEASQQLLFEQNTDILWLDFKHLVTPLLDTMVSNNILSDYNMVKYNIDPESGEAVPAYMVLAHITIRPINSVEVFDLTVILENNDISVAETE